MTRTKKRGPAWRAAKEKNDTVSGNQDAGLHLSETVKSECTKFITILRKYRRVIASTNLPPAIIINARIESEKLIRRIEKRVGRRSRSMPRNDGYRKEITLTRFVINSSKARFPKDAPPVMRSPCNEPTFRVAWVEGLEEALHEADMEESTINDISNALQETLECRDQSNHTDYARNFVDEQIGKDPFYDHILEIAQQGRLKAITWDQNRKKFHDSEQSKYFWSDYDSNGSLVLMTINEEASSTFFSSSGLEPTPNIQAFHNKVLHGDSHGQKETASMEISVEELPESVIGVRDIAMGGIAIEVPEIPESIYSDDEDEEVGNNLTESIETPSFHSARSGLEHFEEVIPEVDFLDIIEKHIDEQLKMP